MYNYDWSDGKETSQAPRDSASSVGSDCSHNQPEFVLNKLANLPPSNSSIVTDRDLNLSQDFRF